MTDKLKAVLIVLGILGLLEQVVFLDLTGDLKGCGLETAIARARHLSSHHASDQDTVARVREHNVKRRAMRQGKALSPTE